MDRQAVERLIDHLVARADAAPAAAAPFYHLKFTDVFPADVYATMLREMPETDDYRALRGRGNGNMRADGTATRVKIDLFPEYLRHMQPARRAVWNGVGKALCSTGLRDAFRRRLAPWLKQRFGADHDDIGMYPVPTLTRDGPGYKIGIHPDTHWKGITVQLYLPRDRSITHIGTVFHDRAPDGNFRRAGQMEFAPNSGYAFAVGDNTFHSVDPVGTEVDTRDSILLTYFVDAGALRFLRNRGKRIGNFILHEVRPGG